VVVRTSPFDLLIQRTVYCCRLPGLLCTSAAAQIVIGFSSIAVTAIAVCGVSQQSAEMLSEFDGSARASRFRSRSLFLRREFSLKMEVERMWGKVMGMTPTARGIVEMTIAMVTMGVVYTGLVFALLYGAIQNLPTHVVGALSFIYPLVAIGVDYVAFGRRLQLTQLIGAIAILVSAAGTTLGWSLPKSKTPEKSAP
jgi:hypothetical protein